MTQPWIQGLIPLGGQAIDSQEVNIFKWTFKDYNLSHIQSAYIIQWKEAVVGSTLNTINWTTSSQSQHSFSIDTFQNAKTYAWRVMVRDNNLTPIESNWSEWVLFKTSSRPQTQITFPINDNDVITSDLLTLQHSYQDLAGQLQTSYQYRLYNDSDLLLWTSDLFKDQNNLVVLPKGLLEQSTYYKVDVTVTDADGLSNTSIKRRFYTNFPSSLSNTTYFQVTPDNENSKLDLTWANSKSILGTYVGSGERYKVAKFGNGIEVSEYGEKVYYDINVPEIFTAVGGWICYNQLNNGTLLYLEKDEYNYARIFYSTYDERFIIEKNVNGNMRVIGSQLIDISPDEPFFYTIKQTKNGLVLYYGVTTFNKMEEWNPFETLSKLNWNELENMNLTLDNMESSNLTWDDFEKLS